MASTINLTSLSNYVNELTTPIYTESVLGSYFLAGCTHQEGIKNADKINAMLSSLQVKAPTCGSLPSPTGSVAPFQNTIQVAEVEVEETLCENDFNRVYLGMYSKIGSNNPDGNIPELFAAAYLTDKAKKVQAELEDEAIKGSPSGYFSTGNTRVTGLLHILTQTGASQSLYANIFGAAAGAAAGTGLTNLYTEQNAIAFVKNIVANQAPDTMELEDMRLFGSWQDYRTWIQAWITANNYFINVTDGSGKMKMECMIPGSNVLFTATRGFNSINNSTGYTKYFVLTPYSNIVYGYDKVSDTNEPLFFYDKLTRVTVFRVDWKIGMGAIYYKYITVARTN